MSYIKSAIPYIGGKHKLLPQIIPLFPDNIDTFIDLFCGGANVGINIKAHNIICNDICYPVINFLRECKENDSINMVSKIKHLIELYELSKTNQEGYLNLRRFYNEMNKDWDVFYTLLCYSFNNQIRFNNKGEFNMPFGKDRSSFNPTLEQKFIQFVDHLKTINITFCNDDFIKLNTSGRIGKNDFVYFDPPYSATTASYNENGGWSKDKDLIMFELADRLNRNNIKFAMSNVLKTEWLIEWSKKYNVHKLNYNYKNCNYQKKDKEGKECEILVTNY